MALDPLSIASDGYLSKYQRTLNIAVRGYLSVYALVVITVPATGGGDGVQSFGYLIGEGKEKMSLAEKEVILHHEDSDVMLIVQIFILKWVYLNA
jgi:hypothetical protein